jgi:N-acetylglutamate synthase-like GNAT family acetyltransferase
MSQEYEVKISNDFEDKVFHELKNYNDQFEPRVDYQSVTFFVDKNGQFVGGLQGFAAWDTFEISNMIVLRRKEGIGTALIKKAEDYCNQRKISKITASTLDFQAPGFYSKLGFKEFATIPNYAGEHTCHYFIKRLNN